MSGAAQLSGADRRIAHPTALPAWKRGYSGFLEPGVEHVGYQSVPGWGQVLAPQFAAPPLGDISTTYSVAFAVEPSGARSVRSGAARPVRAIAENMHFFRTRAAAARRNNPRLTKQRGRTRAAGGRIRHSAPRFGAHT
jgi:hypothetical protein